MPKSTVSLVLRVNHPKGKRTHHTAVVSANGRIKPFVGIVGGKATNLPGSTYYLRYRMQGRRMWESVGNDPAMALVKRDQREHQLSGLKLGLEPALRSGLRLVPDPTSPKAPQRPPLQLLIQRYAENIDLLHGARTSSQYMRDLSEFASVVGDIEPAEVARQDVQLYIRHLIGRKLKPKTIENRLTTLKAFLRHQGTTGEVVNKADAPKHHKKLPHTYSKQQIAALLAASGNEDKLIWQTFLAAGLREQELSHLGWEDINFERGLIHLHAKPDLNFYLKDREERQIPLPTELLSRLRERRTLRPKDRLVFPTEDGKPEGHLLRRLKQIAFAAGLNCGLCRNRAGVSCKGRPVCAKWQLHSFRRTAATRWHEAGLSVPSVQRLLGDSDVETTMRYLTGQDLNSLEFRDSIDKSFATIAA